MPVPATTSPAPTSSRPEAAPVGAAAPRRRALVILNPVAGRSSRRRVERVVAALRRRGVAVEVRRTGPNFGDAERLARAAEPQFDIIVAAGGDGTLHGVVNGAGTGPRPIALLPCGTANVLARDLRLPRRPERLAELIANGPARPVWAGRVGDRLFLTTASSGFDSDTVAAVDPILKGRIGRLAFVLAILTCLLRCRDRKLVVRAEGVEHRAATVIAAKGRLYAGRFVVAPQASLAEPVLDLILFQRSGRAAVLRYLAALVLGRIPRAKGLIFLRCRNAQILAEEPIPVQADGELVGHLPVSLGIVDRPLMFGRP